MLLSATQVPHSHAILHLAGTSRLLPRMDDATSDRHDAARRIQRAARARRVRRAAKVVRNLPTELQKLCVHMAYERSSQQCAAVQASVSRVIAARFAKTGISLGHALFETRSWKDADLGEHLRELREAYILGAKYHEALSLEAVGDMLNSALYYIGMCHYDANGEWMRCQVAMCAFTRAVLQGRVAQPERREAAESMGLKGMIEMTRVMVGC